MWLKRRPQGSLGSPKAARQAGSRWLIPTAVAMGLLLPLFGLSLIVVIAFDRLWLRCRAALA